MEHEGMAPVGALDYGRPTDRRGGATRTDKRRSKMPTATFPHTLLVTALTATLVASATPPAQAGGAPACGTVVGPGETLVLTDDMGPCDDNAAPFAIRVRDGGTLDMATHSITCNDTNANMEVPDGILLDEGHATVLAGSVSGCLNGLRMTGAAANTITGVTATGNTANGVYIENTSGKNRLTSVNAIGNGGNGIVLLSDKNKIKNGNIQNNGNNGVFVGGNKNKLNNVLIAGNNRGIYVEGTGHKILKSTSNNNAIVGIEIGGDDVKVVKSTASQNDGTGILVASAAKVIKSIATLNDGDGIVVTAAGASEVSILKNESVGNGIVSGVDLVDSDCGAGHLWKKNTFDDSMGACVQ
jgi:hypothetical protein